MYLQVRIIRASLTWALRLHTWNTFDWHIAPLVHNKKDMVKIPRWKGFQYKGLLEGSDLQCEIKGVDLGGEMDALWFRPKGVDRKVNDGRVMLYLHGK